MKLRIKGNSLRLRLTKGEIDLLSKDGLIESRINFGSDALVYGIAVSAEIDRISASFNDSRITVRIPEAVAKGWATSEQVGIEATQHVDGELRILIEKDFKCLTTRAGEDDADTFDNPLEGKC